MSSRLSARRVLGAALPLALVAIGVAASSMHSGPGITFKIRTQLKNHQNPEKSKPDSVRIKRLAAEAAARSADDIVVGGDAGGGGGAGRAGGAAGGAGQNNVLMMNGAFIKGAGRFDVVGVIGRVELQPTEAAIITDTSTTIIDDVQKIYRSTFFNIGSILAFTQAVDNAPATIGTLEVSWDSLPAETYEGRPVRHYRMKMAYGFTQRTREDSLKDLSITDVVSDYWVADLPVNFENRFAGIGRPRRQVPDSLRGEWDKMLALYAQLGKGTIVKFSATGVIGRNGNSATEYTRTMEMTGITAADVDENLLKVPEGYAKMTTGRGRGRGGSLR